MCHDSTRFSSKRRNWLTTYTMAPTVTRINFADTALDNYAGFYALVVDNVFSEEECLSLASLAVASDAWKPAGLSALEESQTVHKDFRNSDRVIHINAEVAERIYQRLRPLVEADLGEIAVGREWDVITGKKGRKQGSTYKLSGVNPRLSFLRYGPGHYFKPHCDGLVSVPHKGGITLKSFVTLHLYLNGTGQEGLSANSNNLNVDLAHTKLFDDDPDEPLVGGATRFWTPNKMHYLDVYPRIGRVLIFQQRMLVHSGEEVLQGVKYTMRSDFLFKEELQ